MQTQQNNRVLIADDKEMNRNILARALKARGLESDLASTPQQAVSMARERPYNVIITDLEFTEGGREGYRVLEQIQSLPAMKILYTGAAGFEYAAEGFTSGADYVVLGKDQKALFNLLENDYATPNTSSEKVVEEKPVVKPHECHCTADSPCKKDGICRCAAGLQAKLAGALK
ncbi:MAG: response regulator [archaeon]